MLTVTLDENGHPIFEPRASGYLVYLDNDSLIELAKGDATRRGSFVNSIRSPYSALLFSFANAIEAGGPQGDSARLVRAFMQSIGPHWLPLEMNPWTVIAREGTPSTTTPCISIEFIENYVKQRIHKSAEPGKIIGLDPENFWRLDVVLDWEQQADREETRKDTAKIDEEFINLVNQLRSKTKTDPSSLDRAYPPPAQINGRPANYVLVHLMRALALDRGDNLKAHDGLDLCHAVLGMAYGTIATLDGRWKARVMKALPSTSGLARLYYRPEVDRLVLDLERLVAAAAGNRSDPHGTPRSV